MKSPYPLLARLTWMLVALTLPATALVAQPLVPLQPVQPSPWWAVERFGQNLIESAQPEAATQRLNITVNESVWSTWDYLKRYALVQNLGRVAIAHDYSLYILGSRKNLLMAYVKVNGVWQMQPPSLGANPYRYESQLQFQP